MMIVGMSVVVTVIVLQFHHHDPHGGKMPKWVSDGQIMIIIICKTKQDTVSFFPFPGSHDIVELVCLVSPYEATWQRA